MAPQIAHPDLKRVPMAKGGYGRWLRPFLENRAVSGPVRTFPQAERPLLEAQEIQSLLVVPVFVDGILWGFLGVDDCRRKRSFGPEEEALLRAVAEALARPLGVQAVAEGIEDEAILAYLRELGFPLGQGFLLGRPGPLSHRALSHRGGVLP